MDEPVNRQDLTKFLDEVRQIVDRAAESTNQKLNRAVESMSQKLDRAAEATALKLDRAVEAMAHNLTDLREEMIARLEGTDRRLDRVETNTNSILLQLAGISRSLTAAEKFDATIHATQTPNSARSTN